MVNTQQIFYNWDCIRLNVGSSPIYFGFFQPCSTFMIDNLGDTKIFFAIGSVSNINIGSTIPIIGGKETRSFDLRVSGITCIASGTGNTEVQIFNMS